MLIAQQKRHENIAEYLLYMWQVEDLLRACQLDDDQIERQLVGRFAHVEGVDAQRLAEVRCWYFELRDMMLAEGKRERGHLQINDNVLADLTDLHLRLLASKRDALYDAAFYQTLPYIVELRSREGDRPSGELETCFNALYGLMMLRLQHREVSSETTVALRQVSKFIALLSDRYAHWKSGDLKLDDDD